MNEETTISDFTAEAYIQASAFETNAETCIGFAKSHLTLAKERIISDLSAEYSGDQATLDYFMNILVPIIDEAYPITNIT